jgi:uncharacterized protein (TIGR03437 family)
MARCVRAAALILLVFAPLIFGQPEYPYVVKTLAGSYSVGNGGPATAALLVVPAAAVVDNAGNLYVADGNGNGIRKIANGTIDRYLSNTVSDLRIDSNGNMYAADGYDAIYKISGSGAVSTFAGGKYGFAGDGGPAVSARFASPSGVAVDQQGNVYVADTDNLRVRKITPDGTIQTVAGNGRIGFSGDSGQAIQAAVNFPNSVAVDGAGNLYIGEYFRIRKVTPQGIITTIAGNGNFALDGSAANTAVGTMIGIAVDANGSVYFADRDYDLVRVISNGSVKTLAGKASKIGYAGDGGPASAALLNMPVAVSLDSGGNVYVVDQGNQCIRKISKDGTINTIAGGSHFGGDGGAATSALLNIPETAVTDGNGNVYVSDTWNHRVRKIGADGKISTVAGTGVCSYSGDGGLAAKAGLCYPMGLALDSAGTLYIGDSSNFSIRAITPNGTISTVAGNGTRGNSGDGGKAAEAQFSDPVGIALDSAGNLFVADYGANRVRKINLTTGVVTAFAGTGESGFSGDGALATAALLDSPTHVAVDAAGNVYISDRYNNRVRKVIGGIIMTVAGITSCCGTRINATNTYLGGPRGLTVDASGNLFVSEPDLNTIAKITPSGVYSIIAGNGELGFAGDGGMAANAALDFPGGLSADSTGAVYFTDRYDGRVRVLIPNNPTGISILQGDNQTANVGTRPALPLSVAVQFRGGVPITGLTVGFAVTSGSATLSSPTSSTDTNGTAGVGITLGNTPGPVVVTATLAGFAPVAFHLTATPVIPLPAISAGGVDGAGGSVPAVTQLSPGALATVYGSNFVPAGTSRAVQAPDFANGALPTTLAGVCVLVGGVPAYITYVSPGQINFQVPIIPVNTSLDVQVISNCGTSSATQSGVQPVGTVAATPEFLYWVKNADGHNPVISVNAVTGAYVGAAGLIPGAAFTPAKAGDILTIYGISFGATNPAVAPGTACSTVAPATNPASVTLGSLTVDAADVLYAGISPGTAGLYQLNIRVPAGLADGDYPLMLHLGSFRTAAGGYLTVKN